MEELHYHQVLDMRDVLYTQSLPSSCQPSPAGMDGVSENSNDSVVLEQSALPLELQTKYQEIQMNGAEYAILNGNEAPEFQPRIIIVEEPQQRGFRFRYECEGPSHGGLQGEKSERSRRSYPTIKIENYSGPAKIVVTLVTDEEVPKHHAHKLVGKNCNNGQCVVEVQNTANQISFPNLCVLHVTRKKATEVLEGRICESVLQDRRMKIGNLNANLQLSSDDLTRIKTQAKDQAKSMSLNVARLCFQAYLMDDDKNYNRVLPSAVSRPIFDSKSPNASALKICRMDKYGGCCTGNEEVFLLCEKVQKDDIAVKFMEYDKDGSVLWEAYGNFSPLDVHRQYAIVFRTPPYRNTHIDKAVNVMIMLQRKSDQEVSEQKAFTYYPRNLDKDGIAKKKRKAMPSLDGYGGGSYFGGSGLGGRSGGDFGGSDGGGGFGGQGTHRVILPNGNLVQQQGNVPATIEQAIQECYDSPVNSPYRTDLDELDDGHYDLSIDCEPIKSHKQTPIISAPEHPVKQKSRPGTIKEDVVDGAMKALAISDLANVKTEPGDKDDSKDGEAKDSSSEASGSLAPTEGRTDEGFSESSSILGDLSPKKAMDGLDKSAPQKPSSKQDPKSRRRGKDEAIRMAQRTAIALRDYAETGDIRYLLLLQRHLASIHNENGDLPIHLAVINNQTVALQYLLDVMGTLPHAHSRVNAFNLLRQTALHLAVITKQRNVIEILLHAGADPALCDRHGNTAAHLAVQYGSLECLQSLVRYMQPTANEENPFPELDHLNYEGYAPAHIAARSGNVEMLKTLVYSQADMNLQDGKSGRTPLHHAVEVDDLSTASYLIMETDIDVNARCFDGNTALHIACGRGLVGMVALLMTAGADPSVENEEVPPLVSEGEGELNGPDCLDRRGMRPADYAQDSERILSVLQGDIYQPDETMNNHNFDIQEDGVGFKGQTTDVSFLSLRHESGVESLNYRLYQQGDLEKLNFLVRVELAKLLDPVQPGRDVFSLAEKLEYFNLNNALSAMKSPASPTRFLLDYFEASDGTVTKLRNSLVGMDRQDAVKIIDAALGEGKTGDKSLIDPTRIDSGVASIGGPALSRTGVTS